ncbi:MAG: hypothetical protein ACPGJV_04505 [Bacteriovoracaceae bacterium]
MRKIVNILIHDFSITCTLDNGERYKYEMDFIKSENHEMLLPLRDIHFFKKAYIEYGSLAWPNGYDIHVNTVIRDGKKIEKVA